MALRLAKTMQLVTSDETKLVGNLRTSLVAKVFGKIDLVSKKSVEQLGAEFFDKAKACARSRTVRCPWNVAAAVTSDPAPSVSGPPTVSPVVEYNDEGKAVGLGMQSLLARGFAVGGFAKDSAGISRPHAHLYLHIYLNKLHI